MSKKTTRGITTILMGLGIMGLTFTAQAATPNHTRTGPKDLRPAAKVSAEGKHSNKRARGKEAKKARRAKRMAMLDTNRDGQLQISELVSHRQMKMKARLQKADTNGDGILQSTERKAARQAKKAMKAERRSKRSKNKANRKARRDRRKARASTQR